MIRTVLPVIGLCVGMWLCNNSRAQQGTAANTSGIQCAHGRADSIGINISNNGSAIVTSSPVLTALDQSGVGWGRIAVQWGWIERKQGVYNWQMIDADVDRMLSVHVAPLIVIMGPTPCWSLQSPQQDCNRPQHQLPKKQDWSNFVSTAVSRYKNRVQYWEIWNEPNLVQSLDIPDVNERLTGYREQILIPGAEAVHAADPSAQVVAPTFAANSFEPGALGNALKLVLSSPASHLVDVVSFHSYFPANVNGKAAEIRNAMQSLGIGQKPIWLTETGLSPKRLGVLGITSMSYAETRQADLLKTDVRDVLGSGNIQKLFWFALTDSHDRDGNHVDHYGLVDETSPELKVRPAFTQLQQLIQSVCH